MNPSIPYCLQEHLKGSDPVGDVFCRGSNAGEAVVVGNMAISVCNSLLTNCIAPDAINIQTIDYGASPASGLQYWNVTTDAQPPVSLVAKPTGSSLVCAGQEFCPPGLKACTEGTEGMYCSVPWTTTTAIDVCASPTTGNACAHALGATEGGTFLMYNAGSGSLALPAPPQGQFREFTCTPLGSGVTCLGIQQGDIKDTPKECASAHGKDGTLLKC